MPIAQMIRHWHVRIIDGGVGEVAGQECATDASFEAADAEKFLPRQDL
jgi:hypothetical protein